MRIGYARVSTSDQSFDLQIDALQAAGCERIFREVASGGRAERCELTKALDYLRPGDTLVVWKLDRLARSVLQLIHTLVDFQSRGIMLRSLTEGIDTSTAIGRMHYTVSGTFAEFERELIQSRTREGLAAARRRGRSGGRPTVLDADRKAMALAMLRDESIPVHRIAKQLGIGRSTLYRYFPEARQAAKGAA